MNICSNGTHHPFFKPYVIVTVGGTKVGILGYTTSASEVGASVDPLVDVIDCDWNSTDSSKIHVADYVRDLRDTNGCNVVVLLAHVGHSAICVDGSTTKALIVDDGTVRVPEIAVTGHWHTWAQTVWQPEILNYKTIFTESASYMKYVGELTVDQAGGYIGSAQHVLRNADIKPDPDVAAFVDGLKTQYNANAISKGAPTLDQVIGYSSVPLLLDNEMKWWSPDEYPWSGDNTAGEWICDAMQWHARQIFHTTCDLALEAGGGVRADVPAGPVTFTQIYETFPWNDDLLTLVKMTGQEIWDFVSANNCDAALSQGWLVTAQDGVPVSITINGEPVDLQKTYNVAINNYMYLHPTTGFTYSDKAPNISTVLCRDSIVNYTAQFSAASPMQVTGPRYKLDTEFSGGYRAVVTMLNDDDTSPSYEDAFIRLLNATPETLARRGSKQVPSNLVNADGTVNPANPLGEAELYRSFLGFKKGVLKPGDIIEVWGKNSAYNGNPEFVDQEGIYANGMEFNVLGNDPSLAQPALMSAISSFQDPAHLNHYVKFFATKTGASTVQDSAGTSLTIWDATAYATRVLPGNIGDRLVLTGVTTSEKKSGVIGLCFRCDYAASANDLPVSGLASVDPVQTESSLTLTAAANTPIVIPSTRTVTLTAVADSQVVSGNPDKNYGAATGLYVQSAGSGSYKNERAWMRFDLAGLPAGTALINAARLKMYCWGGSTTTDLGVEVCGGDTDAWGEGSGSSSGTTDTTGATITWNHQPGLLTPLSSVTLAKNAKNVWYSWDVTGFAKNKWADGKLVSLVAKPVAENAATAVSYSFESREWSSGRPSLELDIPNTDAPVSIVQVGIFYRYSADNATWGDWMPYQKLTAVPWTTTFKYPNGAGYYQFYSAAIDSLGNAESPHAQADVSVHYAPTQLVAGSYSMSTLHDRAATISAAKLLRVCTDPSGYSMSIAGVSPLSAQGGAVQLSGSTITYIPAPGIAGLDSFTFIVRDSQGATAQGVVNVIVTAPGSDAPNLIGVSVDPLNATVQMAGIPGLVYQAQASADLSTWVNIGWGAANASGLLKYVDTDKHLYPQRFYRSIPGQIPAAKIAVFSDPHVMAPSLLINDGPAFQAYLAQDRKLLKESQAILDSVVASVSGNNPDIVLVTGDLTKDGELVSHQAAIQRLQILKDHGAKVFVCPGNHDINNPHALYFDGAATLPAATIQAADFASLYASFGYNDAIARDPNSLSYVAEPIPGLLILSMDACHYEKNTGAASPYTGGYFDDARLSWITQQLAIARTQGKFVLGMVHHGVMEHYAGQKALFPEYVLDNYQSIDQLFASYGMKVVFTGHYHAQDVASASLVAGTLFDIETGSTVTYPCPYRVMTLLTNGVLAINSFKVTSIDYALGGQDFQAHAYNFLTNGLMTISTAMLTSPPPYGYGLDAPHAAFLAPAMVEAFASHYQGDESSRPISAYSQYVITTLLSTPKTDPAYSLSMMMATALTNLFHDPAPADNNGTINLMTGSANP